VTQSEVKPLRSLDDFAQPEPMAVPKRATANEILSGGL